MVRSRLAVLSERLDCALASMRAMALLLEAGASVREADAASRDVRPGRVTSEEEGRTEAPPTVAETTADHSSP